MDSQPGGPVRQPDLSFRPASLHRLAESIPRSRFLGSINVYKYGLSLKSQIVVQTMLTPLKNYISQLFLVACQRFEVQCLVSAIRAVRHWAANRQKKARRHIQAWGMEGIQTNREQEYIVKEKHESEQGTS